MYIYVWQTTTSLELKCLFGPRLLFVRSHGFWKETTAQARLLNVGPSTRLKHWPCLISPLCFWVFRHFVSYRKCSNMVALNYKWIAYKLLLRNFDTHIMIIKQEACDVRLIQDKTAMRCYHSPLVRLMILHGLAYHSAIDSVPIMGKKTPFYGMVIVALTHLTLSSTYCNFIAEDDQTTTHRACGLSQPVGFRSSTLLPNVVRTAQTIRHNWTNWTNPCWHMLTLAILVVSRSTILFWQVTLERLREWGFHALCGMSRRRMDYLPILGSSNFWHQSIG